MKFTYDWIKDYVDVKVSSQELANALTMSGSEVSSIEETCGTQLMELEITSNRPDCLNIVGLAREASVVLDSKFNMPNFDVDADGAVTDAGEIECLIKSPELCSYYSARVIKDVVVKNSTGKIQTRIGSLGMRPVNNIVDITNYCLMELGQPLHAFDLDKIKGGKIIVREAKKGEKITTIDGAERELSAGMLVIADAERPVAIAGVMGGLDTEVTEKTKNILLESAYFDPINIRGTARTLALSTDSSYRFERGVDKDMVKKASDRVATLIKNEAGGSILGFYETGDLSCEEVKIELDIKKAERVLGIDLETEWIQTVLDKLGMYVEKTEDGALMINVPSFREDIKKDVDLIEEIARIYGYDKIPETIPEIHPLTERKGYPRQVKDKLLGKIVSCGFSEIMTYSLISETSSDRFSSFVDGKVSLSNPLSEEQKILTPHLLDGMLRSISWNINRKNKDLALFELGKIYSSSGKKGYAETDTLCISLTGDMINNWLEGDRSSSFYDLKGVIEAAFGDLGVDLEFTAVKKGELAPCAAIKVKGQKETCGYVGGVSTAVLKEYDIEQDVFICQIKLDGIYDEAELQGEYSSVPRFPFSTRDISILCSREKTYSEVFSVIEGMGEELVKSIDLIDVFTGKNIPEDMKSLTISMKYGLDTRTLTDEEIGSVHENIKETLVKKLGVTFR